ncbi:MAG: hypothetical protein LBC85_05005 [Fibromonadaceae bacterium]|jgi:microcystin-dependent protein|nr:hypothetical protein [Fibromonadaceae bacterium]
MKNFRTYISVIALFLLVGTSYSSNSEVEFSLLPPRVASVAVQKNSEWEGLMVVLESNLTKGAEPVITDSTIELSVEGSHGHSTMLQTANSTFARGLAWSDGKLVFYLNRGERPAVLLTNNRILLQKHISPGRLENWQALPTGLKSSQFFLPSFEPLALSSRAFADSMQNRRIETDLSLMQSIQVKRTDASYIVTEEIASLFPGPAESRVPLEALEIGDRLKVLSRVGPFYRVRFKNKEGYVFQRDVMIEGGLTTAQRDEIRRRGKEVPGNVDKIVEKYGWRDIDNIVYSSYGRRDPFVQVRSLESDGIDVDHLTLVGIFYENERPMALLSNNKVRGLSHTLYEGDSVKNGRILRITQNGVLFLLQEYGVSRRYTMDLPDRFGGN